MAMDGGPPQRGAPPGGSRVPAGGGTVGRSWGLGILLPIAFRLMDRVVHGAGRVCLGRLAVLRGWARLGRPHRGAGRGDARLGYPNRASIRPISPRMRPRPTLPGTEVPCKVWDLTTGADSHLAPHSQPFPASVQRHPLMPLRHVCLEAERADLRLERDLRLRVAVDEEHLARETGIARPLAGREPPDPVEQLALIGVCGEAGDRADLAADLPDLTVELDRRCTRLEMCAERPFALVPHEQQG